MADQPREATVAQQENNGFGPISKPRGKAATYASVVVVIISAIVLVFSVKKKEGKEGIHFMIFAVALLTLSFFLGELGRRMCLVAEEIKQKEARYEGNWKHVFNFTFTFNYGRCILVLVVGSTVIVVHALYEHNEAFSRSHYAILFLLNCLLVPQLLFLVGLRELSPVETSEINERENKNVADGLAWSYYFGYLKLVLPKLEEQIGKSDDFRYKITKQKLFILLPKTCYTCDDIVDADNRVKFAGHLPEYKRSRGGIRERSYKHAVHRVEMPRADGGIDEYHFVLEYATPLMSLYDMSQHKEACLTRQELNHQVIFSCSTWYLLILVIPYCAGTAPISL